MHPELAVLEELVDIVPGQRLQKTDRQRFLSSLGISPFVDASNEQHATEKMVSKVWILRVLANAAFEIPLPPKWTEQVDDRGYVYFAHALRAEATWLHPLLAAFQETLDFASAIASSSETVDEAAGAVKAHLRQIQDRAARELEYWTGPHREAGSTDDYFFNEKSEESTWESPLESWQYEVHARYWLLVQMLQHMHSRSFSKRAHDIAQPLAEFPGALEVTTSFHSEVARSSHSGTDPCQSFSKRTHDTTQPSAEFPETLEVTTSFHSEVTRSSNSVTDPCHSFSHGAHDTAQPSAEFPEILEVSASFHCEVTRSSHNGTDSHKLTPSRSPSRSRAMDFIGSTVSTAGLSNAVRSHASDIASSLTSSPPSCGDHSICQTPCNNMGQLNHVQSLGNDSICDTMQKLKIKLTPPSQPKPPKRPPPPLRHLTAPPRVTEIPPEHALRVASPTLLLHNSRVVVIDGAPTPPSSLDANARPPPPKKLNFSGMDEAGLETPPDSPKTPQSQATVEPQQTNTSAGSRICREIRSEGSSDVEDHPSRQQVGTAELPPNSYSDREFADRSAKKCGMFSSTACVIT